MNDDEYDKDNQNKIKIKQSNNTKYIYIYVSTTLHALKVIHTYACPFRLLKKSKVVIIEAYRSHWLYQVYTSKSNALKNYRLCKYYEDRIEDDTTTFVQLTVCRDHHNLLHIQSK